MSKIIRYFSWNGWNGFKYLRQEFDNNVLDLVKQKAHSYEYMTDLKSVRYSYQTRKSFSFLASKKTYKEYEHIFKL